jgi:hypothetical protein
VHHLVDLADDEDVGSQGIVDAAYKDRHGSPGVVGNLDAITARVRPARKQSPTTRSEK